MKQKVHKQTTVKIISFIVFATILLPILLLLTSCGAHSIGDFTYEYDYFNQEKVVVITGLTKLGQKKEVIVIPESIKGYRVIGLEKSAPYFLDDPTTTLESENLTALYLYRKIGLEVKMECPNLKKVFVINANDDISLVQQGVGSRELEDKCYIYNEVHFNRAGHYPMPPYPANVTYYYNYEGAENYGCYWLDNLDDGEKIAYIPSDPTREGYKFDGWYHEPECITKWDFETDTVKSSGEEGYADKDKFIENKLYAKWTKK